MAALISALTAAAAVEAPSVRSGARSSVNLTLYRITPRNYTGIQNLDTGDAAGDAFFGLFELGFPLLCQDKQFSQGPNCKDVPILNIPNFNVYASMVVEVDPRFGHYAECNPDPDTGEFECGHLMGQQCWWTNDEWKTDFAGLCSSSIWGCHCKYVEEIAVGARKVEDQFNGGGTQSNASLPASCSGYAGTPIQGYTLTGIALSASPAADEGECCSSCGSSAGCSSYMYDLQLGNCTLFSQVTGGKVNKNFNGAYGSAGITAVLGPMAKLIGGTWFSTQGGGECAEGETVGVDCWWRLREQLRNINASCVNDRMTAVVTSARPSCFAACPQPDNITSDCWIQCLFETIIGNTSTTPPVPPMSRDTIVGAFEGSFAPVEQGGCPEVPPCPPPCEPPTGLALASPQQHASPRVYSRAAVAAGFGFGGLLA